MYYKKIIYPVLIDGFVEMDRALLYMPRISFVKVLF